MGSACESGAPGAALLLAVGFGCTPPAPSGGEGEGTSGLTTWPSDTADTDDASGTSAGSDVDPPYLDIGSGGGACPEGSPCPDPDPVEPALCEQLDVPVCGDGVVGALEECDGGPGCLACQDAIEPIPWITLPEDARIDTLVPLADGGAMVLEAIQGPVTRYHADGTVMWDAAIDEYASDLAVDSADNVFVVGRNGTTDAAVPWMASWDASGTARWSLLGEWFGAYSRAAIDGTRLVVAGATEQQNSPYSRGLIAQYDHEGGLEWSEKISSIMTVYGIALVGDEIAVFGRGLDWWKHRVLLRVDEQGAVRWSTDVSIVDGSDYGAVGLVPDGEGGTWVYGQREDGPWARRHDGDGMMLGELDCIGTTAGSIRQMLVEPDGSLVIAILLSADVLPIDRATPWLAWVSTDGTVTAGARLGDPEATLRTSVLARWPSGALAVGVNETNPDVTRVMVIE